MNNCWIWAGSISSNGYGIYSTNERGRYVKRKAHRLMYELEYGHIPFGKVIDHLCNEKLCVNPEHLRVTTHRENILRSNGMGARWAKRTHCKYGHEFNKENTIIREHGARRCKICRKNRYDSVRILNGPRKR